MEVAQPKNKTFLFELQSDKTQFKEIELQSGIEGMASIGDCTVVVVQGQVVPASYCHPCGVLSSLFLSSGATVATTDMTPLKLPGETAATGSDASARGSPCTATVDTATATAANADARGTASCPTGTSGIPVVPPCTATATAPYPVTAS